jgi:hypothetical protein
MEKLVHATPAHSLPVLSLLPCHLCSKPPIACVLTQGVSEADAPELIAEQQMDTRDSARELQLDPRKGLDPPRAKVNALARELEMDFQRHNLTVSVDGVPPVTVPTYLRSLRGAAKWQFRHLTPTHCTPRLVRDETGARLYADPLSCDWAHEQHTRMAEQHTRMADL